jgi:hypothetical protein
MPPPLTSALFRAWLPVMVVSMIVETLSPAPVVASSMPPPLLAEMFLAMVLLFRNRLIQLAKSPPPAPPLALP